jgi:phospholipid/cholesterol/gamma-HCH transport system substrate-binding protein
MEVRARYVLIGVFTLAVVVAGFVAVYWLNHSGGLGERASYRVRFTTPVAGLLLGSDVLFNGVRVGEVSNLRLDPEKPSDVLATISIAGDTPIRSDTHVGLGYGGLTGTASISLKGGAADAPPLKAEQGGPPVLLADPQAAADWTQAAREAFGKVDTLLSDNSEALHEAIGNINTFAEALARNSDKVDKIVTGLEKMTAGAAAGPATIYDLVAPKDFPPGLVMPKAQLVIAQPTSVVSLETQAFLVGTDASQNVAFPDSKWSDAIPNLIHAKLVEAFENAGYSRTGSDSQGLTADRQLLTDIRAFRVTSGDKPGAIVELTAKIVGSDGQIVDARSFSATAPVETLEAPAAAAGLNQAFAKVATDVVTWALQVP